MQGLWLDRVSWDEADVLLKEARVVVIPIGAGLKEHGHHLPLGNDAILATELTQRLVERAPILACPTVNYGPYPAFSEYPGSVTITPEAFEGTLRGIVQSLFRHGARRFYALNTGISTVASLEKLRLEFAAQDIAFAYMDLRRHGSQVRKEIERQSVGTHADEMETSLMLHLRPSVVHAERAVSELGADRGPGGLTRNAQATGGVYSVTGAWGDPTLATAEKGARFAAAILADVLQDLQMLR
ncbi:MAG: creatininase family protein [Bdellovibrionales bacterium]|nr:creatininase family protein [Bdellovibrionales bacterium]